MKKEAEKRELHLVVKGVVQGVGFRGRVVLLAEKHHLVGTVKNVPDGSVEIYVQGLCSNIKNFVEEIRSFSGFVEVTDIEMEGVASLSTYKNFTIIY